MAEAENTEPREVGAHVVREVAGKGLSGEVDAHHIPILVAADTSVAAKGCESSTGVVPIRQEVSFERVSHESKELRLVGSCSCLKRVEQRKK